MAGGACARCGHDNPPESRFCAICGGTLSRADEPTGSFSVDQLQALLVEQLSEQPAGVPTLEVHRGPKAGSRYALDAPTVTVGRDPDSDIFLDDVTVSRRHAEFVTEGDRITVRDSSSLNGTYVNREQVESAELHDDDEVQIGMFKLVFRHGGPAA
jgi:pSer/pThr/pTyr-binding forkhead associated (FHA) protein